MTYQESQQRVENTLPSDFNRSWDLLVSSGKTVLALTARNLWCQARHIRNRRIELSRRHFERFPVGPQHRADYRHRLAELFEMEFEIDHIFQNQPPPGKHRTHLRLVKSQG